MKINIELRTGLRLEEGGKKQTVNFSGFMSLHHAFFRKFDESGIVGTFEIVYEVHRLLVSKFKEIGLNLETRNDGVYLDIEGEEVYEYSGEFSDSCPGNAREILSEMDRGEISIVVDF